MKKGILTTLFVAITLTSAFAQQKRKFHEKSGVKLTLTITSHGISKTDSIKYASYRVDKLDPDTIANQPMKVEIGIGLDHMDHFFLKAASGDISETIKATIKFYDSKGKLIHTIQVKQAHIYSINSAFTIGYPGPDGHFTSSLSIKAPILIIDGIKM